MTDAGSSDDVPPGYPDHRVVEEELPDGTRVRFRPLRPSDGPTLRHGMTRLSERTRWLRFHSAQSELNDHELAQLLDVDHVDRVAIVAELTDEHGDADPVGVARYARTDPMSADIAVVVVDEFQGRGLGKRLLRHLADTALDNGIVRLTGEVMASNDVVLGLLRKLGPAFECEVDEGEYHTVSWLVPPERAEAEWQEA